MGEGTVVDADAFLMKGSQPRPGSRWRGNPATEVAVGNETVPARRLP
jgi:hypothetical protein